MALLEFVEKQINYYGQAIVDGKDRMDDLALGELSFYITLRRVLKGTGTLQDKGLIDAINDTLQELKVIDAKKTFYKP